MARELPLWRHTPATQPRDRQGRFVRVQHTAARLLILNTARKMREQMGLQDDPRLRILDRTGTP